MAKAKGKKSKKKSSGHKAKFKRIGDECRAEVGKSGKKPMSPGMWKAWKSCLRRKWK